MILIYSILLVLLVGLQGLLQRRAGTLGRRYSNLAQRVQQLVREMSTKPGNGSRHGDLCASAKGQLALALLVDKRDRAETRHYAWQTAADRVGHWAHRLRVWKGLKLPYTMGVVDIGLVMAAVDYLGVGELCSVRSLIGLATQFLSAG